MPDEPTIAAVAAPHSATLDYRPSVRYRTRWGRLIGLVLIALVIAAIMPRMWTEFGYRVGRRDFERSLLTFTAPPGTVAYGEGAAAATVAADPVGSWAVPSIVWQPTATIRGGQSRNAPTWQTWFTLTDYRVNQETTLFLHERTSPNGSRRLVAIGCLLGRDPWAPQSKFDELSVRIAVATSATMLTPSSVRPAAQSTWLTLGKWPHRRTPVRFFVGQPDPTDASRFTIDYAFGDATGTLDGQLRDDGTVSLVAKDGPLAGK